MLKKVPSSGNLALLRQKKNKKNIHHFVNLNIATVKKLQINWKGFTSISKGNTEKNKLYSSLQYLNKQICFFTTDTTGSSYLCNYLEVCIKATCIPVGESPLLHRYCLWNIAMSHLNALKAINRLYYFTFSVIFIYLFLFFIYFFFFFWRGRRSEKLRVLRVTFRFQFLCLMAYQPSWVI